MELKNWRAEDNSTTDLRRVQENVEQVYGGVLNQKQHSTQQENYP